MLKRIALIFIVLSTVATPALPAGKNLIVISQAQTRASMGKLPNSAAFLQIENQGKQDDALVSVSSPAAERIEIHSMSMEGDVMKMRSVDNLTIKAGEKIAMQPGQGYHLMLMGLKKPLKAGEKIPLMLVFRETGKMKISVDVADVKMPGKHGAEHGADNRGDPHEHHDH